MTTDLKIMPVTQCGAVGACQSSPQSYASRMNTYSTPSDSAVADRALQELEAARAKDIATHEANVPAIENNKLVHAFVTETMEAMGMPRRWSERDMKSRARYPKKIDHQAGYLTDLAREVKVNDSFGHCTSVYESLLGRYKEFKVAADQTKANEAKKREQAAEEAKKARRANFELARLVLRCGLDPETAEWGDVLDALRLQHQRINLAVAMMNVRHDWNDGPGEVSDAIAAFVCETPEDIAIANDILRHLGEGWDGDGRCFRDTEWNYTRLLESIDDKQLVADVMTAYGHWTVEH